MKFRLILALSLIRIAAFGLSEKPYDWEKDRKRYVLSEKEKMFNEYVLKYHREYSYDWTGNELFMIVTEHWITHVINSEAIQRHNRIYISMKNVVEVINLKARSINKDGKVVVFDQSNLKEVKDDDANSSFKIFAIEGIEADSELEYFYTLKMTRKLYETCYFQFEMPVRDASLLLTSPKKLAFDFHVYNDSARLRKDTLNGRNRYEVKFANVRGLIKEGFSVFDANRKRVEIKLAYNYASSGARLNTWSDAAKTYYRTLVKIDDQSEKLLDKFAKTLGDNPAWPPVKRIKNVEDNIKSSIKIISASGEAAYGDLPDILKYRQASIQGITSLLVLVYAKLGVPCQVVLTCDRGMAKFDGSFDSWSYLDEYLLFFPETKGFLSPDNNQLRYPLVPPKFTATKGLFIEPVKVAAVRSAIGFVREIPALPYTADADDLLISVRFDPELETNTVVQKRTFTGLDAAYLSPYYDLMTAEQKSKFIEELFGSAVPDIKITKSQVSATTADLLPRLAVETTFSTSHFLETAGKKTLFKVGELIGPQSELYRDTERMTDVENTNNRSYDRVLNIEVPSGYRIGNTEALKMEVSYVDGANIPFLFSSNFTMEGSVLKITIKEFYKEVFAPLSRYEDFRKVVNAAADFNKVTLILEPQ